MTIFILRKIIMIHKKTSILRISRHRKKCKRWVKRRKLLRLIKGQLRMRLRRQRRVRSKLMRQQKVLWRNLLFRFSQCNKKNFHLINHLNQMGREKVRLFRKLSWKELVDLHLNQRKVSVKKRQQHQLLFQFRYLYLLDQLRWLNLTVVKK